MLLQVLLLSVSIASIVVVVPFFLRTARPTMRVSAIWSLWTDPCPMTYDDHTLSSLHLSISSFL